MSIKKYILDNIRKNTGIKHPMPDIEAIEGIVYKDKIAQFIEVSKSVGGDAEIVNPGEDINRIIVDLYPDAKQIASNLPEITGATVNPDTLTDPYPLNGTDLAIIKGEIGVAENGCVWIPLNVKQKAVYFVSEYLVIFLKKENIVNNMHEAYDRINFHDKGFGVFISGPSKTADIEQSLVVGAHGAKGVTVLLI